MVNLLSHLCVTQPKWVKSCSGGFMTLLLWSILVWNMTVTWNCSVQTHHNTCIRLVQLSLSWQSIYLKAIVGVIDLLFLLLAIQYDAVITWSISSQILTIYTPLAHPCRVAFVNITPALSPVSLVLYEIPVCYTRGGGGTPYVMGDTYVPRFWPPFFTLAGSSTIFLGCFFSSTNTKTIFWVQILAKFDLFGPKIPFFPRSFWVQFSVARGTPPSNFRTEYPPRDVTSTMS